MATTSSAINDLYADIVADLIPYYDNAVLLPNPQLIVNSYNLTGAVGNTMKIPLTDAWTGNVTAQAEQANVLADNDQSFTTSNVTLSVSKRAAGAIVSEEALEDGGMEIVRNATLLRLSRSIAQATDQVGFNFAASGAEADLTDIANISGISNDSGLANTDLSTADISFVMSPEWMAYAVKREPTVKMFNDISLDRHEFVASLRNGFTRLRTGSTGFGRCIIASDDIGEANSSLRVSLNMVGTSVANLRKSNAPVDGGGFYVAVVSPAHEFHLAKELNGTGASGGLGSIAQDLANQALIDGLIGQAVGCRFIRSNNVPSGLASA